MERSLTFFQVVDAIFDYTKQCKEQRAKWGNINDDKKAVMDNKYKEWIQERSIQLGDLCKK